MFRLSKATDYGIRILAHLAQDADEPVDSRDGYWTAREVSEQLVLPLPMVSRVKFALFSANSFLFRQKYPFLYCLDV